MQRHIGERKGFLERDTGASEAGVLAFEPGSISQEARCDAERERDLLRKSSLVSLLPRRKNPFDFSQPAEMGGPADVFRCGNDWFAMPDGDRS